MSMPQEKVLGKDVLYRLLARALMHGGKMDCDLQFAQKKNWEGPGNVTAQPLGQLYICSPSQTIPNYFMINSALRGGREC